MYRIFQNLFLRNNVMTSLLLYLHPFDKHKTPVGVTNFYPYNQMVNNVLINQIDPYKCKLFVYPFSKIIAHDLKNKTFEEICLQRAQEINQYDGNIFLKYSGGTDSTVALLSMLRTWGPEELKKLNIVMTNRSINEFPKLWPEIKETFKGRIFDALENDLHFHQRGIVITGECGDQLFGSSILLYIFKNMEPDSIYLDWQKTIPMIYSKMLFNNNMEETVKFIDRYKRTLSYCPFPIKSTYDWVWWFNYTNKIQHVVYRDLVFEPKLAPTFEEKHKSFYYHLDFLKWSLENHDKKIRNSLFSYKFPAKQFIEKYTGFKTHWIRRKIGSRTFLWNPKTPKIRFEHSTPIGEIEQKNFMHGIDENLNYLSFEECEKYIRNPDDYR